MPRLYAHIVLATIASVLFLSTSAQDSSQLKGFGVKEKKAASAFTGDTYAIIVGVSNYPGIQPLKFADKDAQLFHDFLQTPAGGNTKKENIFMLLNDSAKAVNFNVKAYGWLKRKSLKPGDRLYLFFSGHGDAMNEDNYFFLPYDCYPNKDDNNYLGTGYINMHTVKTLFIKPLAKKGVEVMLIVDACRTNELPGGEEGQKIFTTYVQGIAEQKQGEIIMLSTGAGQFSIESQQIGNGHGLFTWYLIDGLSGSADKEGDAADNNGYVSLGEITSWVKNRVQREARQTYKMTQVPFFCCAENDLSNIVQFDSLTYKTWSIAKTLRDITGNQNLFDLARKKLKTASGKSNLDTGLIALYNQFVQAEQSGLLLGSKSAEFYYNQLEKRWPGYDLTEEARYSLASAFINFGQQKINMYLSGKRNVHLKQLEKQYQDQPDSVMSKEVMTEVKKMKTLAGTDFSRAALMTEKAIILLSKEPELLNEIYPKYYFLKAQGIIESNYEQNILRVNEAIYYCRKAIAADTSAAYNYCLMGYLMEDLEKDSCEYYHMKASRLAPKWSYPVNGLGNYYSLKNKPQLALEYYRRSVELDSLFANGWYNIGRMYADEIRNGDSVKYFYNKSLSIQPNNPYPHSGLGYMYSDSFRVKKEQKYFDLALYHFKRSIEYDSSVGSSYTMISNMFESEIERNPKYVDSCLKYLRLCNHGVPDYSFGFIRMGWIYHKFKKDEKKADEFLNKAIKSDSANYDTYLGIARLFRDEKGPKELVYLKKALDNFPENVVVLNAMGNYYYDQYINDTALIYYQRAITIDSTLPYVQNNLGLVYNFTDPKKAIYHFEKAIYYDSARFYYLDDNLAELYKMTHQYEKALGALRTKLQREEYSWNRQGTMNKIIAVLALMGRYEEAKDSARTEFESDRLHYYHNLGKVYGYSGDHKKAEFYLMAALLGDTARARQWMHNPWLTHELQKKMPGRTGLLSSLYRDMMDESVFYERKNEIIISKIKADTAFLAPYTRLFGLWQAESAYSDSLSFYTARADYALDADVLNIADSVNEGNDHYYLLREYQRNTSYRTLTLSVIAAIKKELEGIKDENLKPEISFYIGELFLQLFKENRDDQSLIDSAKKYFNTVGIKDNRHLATGFSLIATTYMNLGETYMRNYSEYVAKAISAYKTAIQLDKNFIYPYAKLGAYYLTEGKLDSALLYLNEVIRLDPDFPEWRYQLSKIYTSKKDYQTANKILRDALLLNPNYADTYRKLGDNFIRMLMPDSALLYYNQMLEKDTLQYSNILKLEMMYSRKPAIQESAIKFLRNAELWFLTKKKGTKIGEVSLPAILIELAEQYQNMDDSVSAIKIYLKGFNDYCTDEQNWYGQFATALTKYYSKNYPPESEAFFEKLIAVGRDGSESLLHLARFYAKTKNDEKLFPILKSLLQPNPDLYSFEITDIVEFFKKDKALANYRNLQRYKELLKNYPLEKIGSK